MKHIPVLLKETADYLSVEKNYNYIDATFGAGGHTQAILKTNGPNGVVLAIDADPRTQKSALPREYQERVFLHHTYFDNLQYIMSKEKYPRKYHGIVVDLGLSSMQLDDDDRGFSFKKDAILDMRFQGDGCISDLKTKSRRGLTVQELREILGESLTAYHLVNFLSEQELAKILFLYGEEKKSRSIAKAIIEDRKISFLSTTRHLVQSIMKVKKKRSDDNRHPATQSFQALRITVNRELERLQSLLDQTLEVLEKKSRLCVITFHSLEDRFVKHYFRYHASKTDRKPKWFLPEHLKGETAVGMPLIRLEQQKKCDPKLRIITQKPVVPTSKEIYENPRSRSAKLRVAETM